MKHHVKRKNAYWEEGTGGSIKDVDAHNGHIYHTRERVWDNHGGAWVRPAVVCSVRDHHLQRDGSVCEHFHAWRRILSYGGGYGTYGFRQTYILKYLHDRKI